MVELQYKKKANNIAAARRFYEKKTGGKYTQEDAAREFGINLSTYRNYEQEKSLPDGGVAAIIAKKYGVTVDYLMGLSDVRFAVIPVPEVYDDDEKELVSLYRQLDEHRRERVLEGVRDYVVATKAAGE